LAAANDENRRLELEADYEEKERRARRRSTGNVQVTLRAGATTLSIMGLFATISNTLDSRYIQCLVFTVMLSVVAP